LIARGETSTVLKFDRTLLKLQPRNFYVDCSMCRTTMMSVLNNSASFCFYSSAFLALVTGRPKRDVERNVPANAPAVKARSKTHCIAMAGWLRPHGLCLNIHSSVLPARTRTAA